MGKRSKVRDFLDAYRAAFEAFDVSAIADLFSYPCQITADAGEIDVTLVPTREAWLPQIERLVAAYRAMDVRSADLVELRVFELTPRLALAAVRWRLIDREGATLYDFDAAYTLADLGQGMRITAIVKGTQTADRCLGQRVRRIVKGTETHDHARDLPIHESVLVRTTHGRRGSSMPEAPSTPGS
jgi:hypothetical protein